MNLNRMGKVNIHLNDYIWLVLNVYETTGKVVFQGKASGSDFAIQINEMIDTINKVPVHENADE